MKKILIVCVMILLCAMLVSGFGSGRFDNEKVTAENQERVTATRTIMNKMSNQHAELLSGLGELEFIDNDDSVNVKGKKDAMLLGMFRFRHTYRYRVLEDGELVRMRSMFERLFITDLDEVEI